ncbi:MAG: hypothetical protein AAF411_01960 [Myxococcota bacterium]
MVKVRATRRFRRWFRRAALVVIALAVFLRLPLRNAPSAGWPAALPSMPTVAEARTLPPTPAPERLAPIAPPRVPHPLAAVPFHYAPPSTSLVRPLVGASLPIAALLEARVDDRVALGDSTAAGDAVYLLGIERSRRGDFAAAADYFETFARTDDSSLPPDEAAAALETAITYRRALGQHALERNAVASFARFEAIAPRAATRIALGGELADLAHARTRRLPPAERIQVEVRYGERLWSVDRTAALRAFRRAERTWRRYDGANMPRSPRLGTTEWLDELARVRESLAQARFMRADLRYRSLRAQRAPSFRGRPTVRRVDAWLTGRLRPWLVRRLARIQRVEAQLGRVDEVGTSSRSVAAAARRGQLYADVYRELQRVVPKTVETLEGTIERPMENLREDTGIRRHLVEPALAHFRACMEVASVTLAYGEWSERCADGLGIWVSRFAHRPERGQLWTAESVHQPGAFAASDVAPSVPSL